MLLQILAVWPLPEGPAWMIVRPIARSIGSARAKASASPPTMKVRVPASAPIVPPDTGASIICKPLAAASAATARAVSTSIVEQSISSAPGLACASDAPSGPR